MTGEPCPPEVHPLGARCHRAPCQPPALNLQPVGGWAGERAEPPLTVFDLDDASRAAIDAGAMFQVVRAEWSPDGAVRIIREVRLHDLPPDPQP